MRNRLLPVLLVLTAAVCTTKVSSSETKELERLRHPQSVIAYPGVVTHTQPDGTLVDVRQFGDERSHRMETLDGYTIALNPATGFLEYASPDPNGALALSGFVVGQADPAALALPKNLRESKTAVEQRRKNEIAALKARFRERYGGVLREAVEEGIAREIYPATGDVPILVIMVNFDDTTTTVEQSGFDKVFNGNPFSDPTTTRSVWHYYDEISYGQVNIQATVTDWQNLSNGKAAYGDPDTNAVFALAEAIDLLFAAAFDFSPFDIDGDGILEPVILLHSGEGEEVTGIPADIWSHQSDFTMITGAPYAVDSATTTPGAAGLSVDEYTAIPELQLGSTTTIGVIVHEMGHAFGLPDLYDTQGDSEGIGDWGLMASGSWNMILRPGDTPAHMCVWSKEFLGWLPMTEANGLMRTTPLIGAQLPAVEYDQVAYRVNMGPDPTTGTEYILIENRQLLGYDEGLPNFGMLAFHVDMSQWVDPGFGFNDNQDRYGVALLQADGKRDLELNQNRGDLGDPFPGTYVNRSLGPTSRYDQNSHNPDTNSYDYGDTNIWFVNISDPFSLMTVDIRFFANLRFPGVPTWTMPVTTTISFRDGSQRPVYAPGTPINYNFEVLNQDDNYPNAPLCEDSNLFWVELWASRANGLTFDYYAANSILVDPGIAGNDQISLVGTGALNSIPDGAYVPTITLDRPDMVWESAELDNRYVLPGPSALVMRANTDTNLTVENFSFGPQWVAPGATINLGGQVINNGTVPSGPFWVEFWGSIDAPGKYYPTLDFFLCESLHVTSLAAGASIDLSGVTRTMFGVPGHEVSQTFTVGCLLDRTDLVNETNETDNYQFVGGQFFPTASGVIAPDATTDAEAAPDQPALVIRDVSRQQLPNLGIAWSTTTLSGLLPPDYLQVDVTVHNYGDTTATASWVHVYVSVDGGLSPDDYLWVSGIRAPDIGPGADWSISVPTGPPQVPLGAYRMLVQCDVLDEVIESDEVLNVFDFGPILVGPDLTFNFVDFQEQAPTFVPALGVQFSEPGTSIVLTAHVANNGVIEAGPFWLEFWGSRIGGLTLDDLIADSHVMLHGVPPLTTLTLVLQRSINSIPDAPYTVTFVADRLDDVTEVFEANNRAPHADKRIVELRAIRKINLRMQQFRFGPNPLHPGEPLKFSGSITNQGTEHSGPFWIEVWGSRITGLATLDFPLCDSIYIENLFPGQHVFLQPYVRNAYMGIPTDTEIAVIVVADRPDHIAEFDESDNFQLERQILVLPPPPPVPFSPQQ